MRQDIKEKIEQIKNGQVPQGYTQTKFGVFPNDWHIANLNKNADIYDGTHQTPNYTNSGIKFVSVENIKDLKSDKYISVDDYKKQYKIKPQINDILMTRIGDIGTANIINTDEDLAYYVTLSLIRSNSINSVFLKHAIFGDLFQKELYKKTLHVAFPRKINLGDIGKCKLLKPKEEKEQEKIASVLEEWDKAIELKTSLIDKLKTQKKALMQKLLAPKPDWQKVKMLTLIDNYDSRTTINNQHTILSSTQSGIYLQKDYFNKQTASTNNIGYKIVPNGYFVYRSMSDTNFFKFNIQTLIDIGIVSPAYPVFMTKTNISKSYLYYYLNFSPLFKTEIIKTIEGSTRKALSFEKFVKLKVYIPNFQQQQKIAEVLSMADDQIELQQKELEQLEKQKKALMQLLLTGIVRFI